MTHADLSPRQIANALHITTQRVYQILKDEGLAPGKGLDGAKATEASA